MTGALSKIVYPQISRHPIFWTITKLNAWYKPLQLPFMRLKSVNIRNFRSLKNETITLFPQCRILVGINESGKTNVLHALSLLDPRKNAVPDDIREISSDENPNDDSKIIYVFETAMAERQAAAKKIRDKIRGDETAPIFQIEEKTYNLEQLALIWTDLVYCLDIKTNKRWFSYWLYQVPALVAGWKKIVKATSISVKGVTQTLNAGILLSPSFNTELPAGAAADLTRSDLGHLLSGIFGESAVLPKVVFWEYDEENLLPGSIDYTNFSTDPSSCMPLKHMFAMAGYSNPTEALLRSAERKNGTQNLLDRIAEKTTKHILKVWSEFKGLSIQLSLNGTDIEASIKDSHNRYDLSRRSDGFKKFVSFLLIISAQSRAKTLANVLYLHDEPENSLHPSGAKYLRDELIRLSSDNQVVYTTHSIFMIDRENLDRHLLVKKKHEVTTLSQANESNIIDEEVIYNALGYSIFESIGKNNIIFEGWRDKTLFRAAIKLAIVPEALKLKLKGIGLCHAKGVKGIEAISPLLELVNRNYIIVSDADSPAKQKQKEYRGDGQWLRYDQLGAPKEVVTGEDFIEWNAFDEAIKASIARHPLLSFPKDFSTLQGSGKMEKLKSWLRPADLSNEDLKDELNQIKELVFAELKPSSVDASYLKIIEGIANAIED